MDTEYECVHCGAPLYFDTKALHFKHAATLSKCAHPLAHAVPVVVGVVCPPGKSRSYGRKAKP